MYRKMICDICKSELEYNDKSIWEGNREMEEINCPVCGNTITTIFTDLIPEVKVIKCGNE